MSSLISLSNISSHHSISFSHTSLPSLYSTSLPPSLPLLYICLPHPPYPSTWKVNTVMPRGVSHTNISLHSSPQGHTIYKTTQKHTRSSSLILYNAIHIFSLPYNIFPDTRFSLRFSNGFVYFPYNSHPPACPSLPAPCLTFQATLHTSRWPLTFHWGSLVGALHVLIYFLSFNIILNLYHSPIMLLCCIHSARFVWFASFKCIK